MIWQCVIKVVHHNARRVEYSRHITKYMNMCTNIYTHTRKTKNTLWRQPVPARRGSPGPAQAAWGRAGLPPPGILSICRVYYICKYINIFVYFFIYFAIFDAPPCKTHFYEGKRNDLNYKAAVYGCSSIASNAFYFL